MGVYIAPNGKLIIGWFKDNKLHGKVRVYFPNGDIFIGNSFEGIYDGYGEIYIYDNNNPISRIIGNFKEFSITEG